MNRFYEALVNFAHTFAALARLQSALDGKSEVTKRTVYVVTLDRRLDEIR